jgi:hypothetical protein
MSTPGPERVPSTVKVDKTSGQGKPPASKASPGSKPSGGAKSTPGKKAPAGKGPKGRKPVKPVSVTGNRNWGPILVFGAVVVIALGIVGFGVFAVLKDKKETSKPWDQRTNAISGVVDYRDKYPDLKKSNNHKTGPLTFPVTPPVGGQHNPVWQNCMGDVYTDPIPKENAVHSLEHGAVWVTYKPGLDAAQVTKLSDRVKGKDYLLMSPFTGLDSNVSLQAWGFQLKLDSADDPRIDAFIKAARVNASMEPGAVCSSGSTATGDVPPAAGS